MNYNQVASTVHNNAIDSLKDRHWKHTIGNADNVNVGKTKKIIELCQLQFVL